MKIDKNLNEEIKVNDTLNPKLWNEDDELRDDVKERLLDIADSFLDDLKEDGLTLDVVDIRLLGSSANYNYTDMSDIDLHIVADLGTTDDIKIMQLLCNAYKSLFNSKYEIKVKGREVELYVEDVNQPAKSNGVYSLYTGWIKKPVRTEIPEIDYDELEKQFDEWEDRYFDIVGEHSVQNDELEEDLSQEVDSEGNPLSNEQVEFFKNSKIRDNQGRLLVVYHGSPNEFGTFNTMNPPKTRNLKMQLDFGSHFTIDKKASDCYGSKKYTTYLNITNPIKIDDPMQDYDMDDLISQGYDGVIYNPIFTMNTAIWTEQQYFDMVNNYKNKSNIKVSKLELTNEDKNDSVYGGNPPLFYANVVETLPTSYIAFYPNQIKSIDNKNPSDNDNINESKLLEIYPKDNETKKDFISRFMSATEKEYPNQKQRLAVAYSYWDKKDKHNETLESKCSRKSFKEKLGYRTEDTYGSGVRDLKSIIEYEMIELGNIDIPLTILDNFDTTEEERTLLSNVEQMDTEDKNNLVDIILNIINRKYPNAKYGLWLCDNKKDVKNYYGGSSVDKYNIENDTPISDLGEEGKLYVFDKEPVMESLKESNDTIRLYTVQDEYALDELRKGKIYVSDPNRINFSDYKKQYRYLSDIYGFKNYPIFLADENSKRIIEASGIAPGGFKVMLTLDVPKYEVHKHFYYTWSDFLYFTHPLTDEMEKYIVDCINNDYPIDWSFQKEYVEGDDEYALGIVNNDIQLLKQEKTESDGSDTQYVIDHIDPSWLVDDKKESLTEMVKFDEDAFDVYMFESPYQVKNFLLSKTEPQRLYIEGNLYLVADAYDCVHTDMKNAAYQNGYLSTDLVNDFDKNQVCAIYCPDSYHTNEFEIYDVVGDDYNFKYKTDDGYIYSRYQDIKNFKLFDVLGGNPKRLEFVENFRTKLKESDDFDYGTGDVNGSDIFDTSTTGTTGSWRDLLLGNDVDYYKNKKNLVGEIVQMSPQEYYEACANMFSSKKHKKVTADELKQQREYDKKTLDYLKTVITDKKKKFPIAVLDLSYYPGQEGLHRMMVAGDLFGWDTKFPVLVIKTYDQEKQKRIERNYAQNKFTDNVEKAIRYLDGWEFYDYDEFYDELMRKLEDYIGSSDIILSTEGNTLEISMYNDDIDDTLIYNYDLNNVKIIKDEDDDEIEEIDVDDYLDLDDLTDDDIILDKDLK